MKLVGKFRKDFRLQVACGSGVKENFPKTFCLTNIAIFTKYCCLNAPKTQNASETPFGSGHTLETLNHGLGSLFCCFITPLLVVP